MKLFVTGATGFLGRAFCGAAAAAGHDLLALCRSPDAGLPVGCIPVVGTLQDVPWQVIEKFQADAVLHLAWIATPGVYLTSPENATLVQQSKALFRGLLERGTGHLAGVGTCIEYKPSSQPLHELHSPLGAVFPYSEAKAELCRWLLEESGEGTRSWFRVFYPYGVDEHPGRFTTHVIRQLSAGKTVELKTPQSVKDYIYITDVAEAMLAALEHRLPGAVNIGAGVGVNILDLAQTLARSCEVSPDLVRRAEFPAEDPFPVTISDIGRIQSLGWNPKVSLAEGLERLRFSLRST